MKIALEEPLPNPIVLNDGFWHTTRVQATQEDQLDKDGEDLEEFGEDDAYVEPLRNRPLPSFRVARDVFEGYFVAIRPADGDSHPIWIGRALSNPNSSPENPNCILINTSVQHRGIRMCKTSTLDGTMKEVYVGE